MYFSAKSRGLSQAKPEPSLRWGLWLGPEISKARAASSQAKAAAFGPSRALHITNQPCDILIFFLGIERTREANYSVSTSNYYAPLRLRLHHTWASQSPVTQVLPAICVLGLPEHQS